MPWDQRLLGLPSFLVPVTVNENRLFIKAKITLDPGTQPRLKS